MIFTFQRNGYGYGFVGAPIILATTVLVMYMVLVCTHLVSVLRHGRIYDFYSQISQVLVLAWTSTPVNELKASEHPDTYEFWSQLARTKRGGSDFQLALDLDEVPNRSLS